jgi:hypothetical protein
MSVLKKMDRNCPMFEVGDFVDGTVIGEEVLNGS